MSRNAPRSRHCARPCGRPLVRRYIQTGWADESYTGQQPRDDAKAEGFDLRVVKLPEAKKGFVLLPRRWVVERSFGWLARFRQLSRDFERTSHVLAALHFVIFTILMLSKTVAALSAGPRTGETCERRAFALSIG